MGIQFIISVTGHHHLSLIPCLQSQTVLTQPRRLSSPAVLTHALPSSDTPYSPAQFWPSCHLPCRPHKSAISHVSHNTKNGLACRAWPSLEDFSLHGTTASGPVLCHPSCPLGIIPVVRRGAPVRFGILVRMGIPCMYLLSPVGTYCHKEGRASPVGTRRHLRYISS